MAGQKGLPSRDASGGRTRGRAARCRRSVWTRPSGAQHPDEGLPPSVSRALVPPGSVAAQAVLLRDSPRGSYVHWHHHARRRCGRKAHPDLRGSCSPSPASPGPPHEISDFAGTPGAALLPARMLNTLSPVLGGSLDLDYLSPKSLGRASGRTSSRRAPAPEWRPGRGPSRLLPRPQRLLHVTRPPTTV